MRVTTAGFKSFVWQGRIKGRAGRITLGEYPVLSVAQARQKSIEIKAAVGRGEDPTLERERGRTEPTFGEVADAYLKDAEVRGLRSLPRSKGRLETHTKRWRTRKLSDISRIDLDRLHHQVGEERGRVIANRVVTLIRRVFNQAGDRGLFKGENPASRVKLFHEQPRERFLSPDEFTRVNQALAEEPN